MWDLQKVLPLCNFPSGSVLRANENVLLYQLGRKNSEDHLNERFRPSIMANVGERAVRSGQVRVLVQPCDTRRKQLQSYVLYRYHIRRKHLGSIFIISSRQQLFFFSSSSRGMKIGSFRLFFFRLSVPNSGSGHPPALGFFYPSLTDRQPLNHQGPSFPSQQIHISTTSDQIRQQAK